MSKPIKYQIHVVPYNPDWPISFEQEKNRLMELLGSHVTVLEHVGSTSIPGQEAKPIIDMFAGVPVLQPEQIYVDLLCSANYCYVETGMTGRHLFVKDLSGERTHHLHVLPMEGFYERNELLFRSCLQGHPEFVKEYGELKRRLAAQYPNAPEEYTRAKTAFIQRVVDQARTERGLPLQQVWE